MRNTDEFDSQIDGQMTIADLYNPKDKLFAVHRIFARAKKEMTLTEQKTFVYALSQFKFTEEAQSNYVRLDKKTLASIVGIHSDPDHLSVDLFDNIKDLTVHSRIEIREKDLDFYASGFVISSVVSFKNFIRIRFNEDFLPLFTNLTKDYITMWSTDIFQMKSRRSVRFYNELRQLSDDRVDVHQHGWGIRRLKEMFEIPKDGKGSYMSKEGHFLRTHFEKKVIDPICEDLSHCRMIQLILQPDGKYYEKVKIGNRVDGYRFYWTYTAHPAVATANEVRAIQERGDRNPELLRVARDILQGGKKQKNQFNQFSQNQYDWDVLEEDLLNN